MAVIPGGVRVGGFISPTDDSDTYATHDSLYGKGGAKEVADLTARDAISADRRREGLLCYVISEQKNYQLVGGIDNVNWEEASSSTPVTTEGDLIVGNASGEEDRLAIGTNGQILGSDGSTVQWQDPPAALTQVFLTDPVSLVAAAGNEYNISFTGASTLSLISMPVGPSAGTRVKFNFDYALEHPNNNVSLNPSIGSGHTVLQELQKIIYGSTSVDLVFNGDTNNWDSNGDNINKGIEWNWVDYIYGTWSSNVYIQLTLVRRSTETVNITAATQANPCQITTGTAHGLSTGDSIDVDSVGGMTELNGRSFLVTVIDTTNFTLDGIDSTSYTPYASGGTANVGNLYKCTRAGRTGAVEPTWDTTIGNTTSDNTVVWTRIPNNLAMKGHFRRGYIWGSKEDVIGDTSLELPSATASAYNKGTLGVACYNDNGYTITVQAPSGTNFEGVNGGSFTLATGQGYLLAYGGGSRGWVRVLNYGSDSSSIYDNTFSTGSIANGGTYQSNITTGSNITSGNVQAVQVSQSAGNSDNIDIEFYDGDPSVSGVLKYSVQSFDVATASLDDRNVWWLEMGSANNLYIKIDNNAVTSVTLDVRFRIKGD